MALMRNLVLVLSLLVVGPWASVTGLASSLPEAPAIRLCGRRLADLVWMICMDRGGVHSHMDRRALSPVRRPFIVYRPAPLRRDGGGQGGADEDGSSSSSSAEAVTTTAPAAATYNRHHASSHVQSSSGGIVEECCHRPCSFSTLASYCARPSDGSSLDAFNLIASSGGSAPSSFTSSSSSEGGQSGMQGDQASSSLVQEQPEPPTTRPPRIASSARLQTAHEVNREHNEVDRARPQGRPGAPSRLTTGRMLPGTAFLTSPEDDTPFSTRPRIGTFSRHRPYWYVVQAAFNGDAEEEGLDA